MTEVVKKFNTTTWLVLEDGVMRVYKAVGAEDIPLCEKLIKLRSEQIARVFRVTEFQGVPCVVMEFVEGVTLEKALGERGTFPPDETRDLMLQLCEGLGELHRNGIVHRDVTPSNLILTPDSKLKIIDFDISRIRKQQQSRDTEILGTQGYAAPEQYGFGQTSARSDIYSVGALMNVMLTGALPGEQMADGPLAPIIRKCTQMDEANRYENMADLAAALKSSKPAGRKLSHVPGFRQNVRWHKVVAGIYYLFTLTVLLACLVAYNGLGLKLLGVLSLFLMFGAPVLILLDYRNWVEHSKVLSGTGRGAQVFVQLMLTALSFVAGFLILDHLPL